VLLSQLVAAYRAVDPQGWLAVYRVLPTWAAAVLLGVGGALLLAGGRRFVRPFAIPLFAWAGLAWVSPVLAQLGVVPTVALERLAAVALAVVAALVPALGLFVGAALLGGHLGGLLGGVGAYLTGFVPGAMLGGAAALALLRPTWVLLATAIGGWLSMLGGLVLLRELGAAQVLERQPWGAVLAAALIALAGAVYQLALAPSPEELAEHEAERAKRKERAREQKALEKRWANYQGSGERKE
jgi:hypothetical protein